MPAGGRNGGARENRRNVNTAITIIITVYLYTYIGDVYEAHRIFVVFFRKEIVAVFFYTYFTISFRRPSIINIVLYFYLAATDALVLKSNILFPIDRRSATIIMR